MQLTVQCQLRKVSFEKNVERRSYKEKMFFKGEHNILKRIDGGNGRTDRQTCSLTGRQTYGQTGRQAGTQAKIRCQETFTHTVR